MKIFKSLILTIFKFYLISSFSFAQAPLSIEDAVEIALKNNYSIKISRNDEKQAIVNQSHAIYNFLPEVNAVSGYNINDINGNLLNREGVASSVNIQGKNFSAGIVGSWTIFDGLGMFKQYEILNEQRHAEASNTKVIIENTIADVLSSYYTLVIEKERLGVIQKSIEISETRLRIAKDKYEVGNGSKMEYLSAQVDCNMDKSALQQQKEIVEVAKLLLNEKLGRDVKTELDVVKSFTINYELSLDELLASGNVNNSQLIQAQRAANISYLEGKLIASEKFPKLNLNLGYNYNQSNNPIGFFPQSQQWGFNYGLTASWRLFGAKDVSRRQQINKLQTENSKHSLEALKLSLETDISRNFLHYSHNLINIELENENVKVARENEEIALERYKLGVASPIELREAQINALNAELRKLNTSFDAKLSEIELVRLSGNILKKHN